jgi:hypothetical protein
MSLSIGTSQIKKHDCSRIHSLGANIRIKQRGKNNWDFGFLVPESEV